MPLSAAALEIFGLFSLIFYKIFVKKICDLKIIVSSAQRRLSERYGVPSPHKTTSDKLIITYSTTYRAFNSKKSPTKRVGLIL